MKTEITRAEYLQLLGLKTLTEAHNDQVHQLEAAAMSLLDVKKDDDAKGTGRGGAEGWVTQTLWGDTSLPEMCERLGITVEGGIPA